MRHRFGGHALFEAAADLIAVDNGTSVPESRIGFATGPSHGTPARARSGVETTTRRTPRRSVIVVLTENHAIAADLIDDRLPSDADRDQVDVIVACAGQPRGIGSLPARLGDVQVVLAPAGTSGEDLRQLAMQHAAGDIVTLVSGI